MTDSTPPPPDAPEPLTAQCVSDEKLDAMTTAFLGAFRELSSFRAVCRVCGVAGAAELGELLAALPKTADGKPITPKTELWHPKDLAAGFDKPVTGDWLRSQMNCPRWGNYYSTRAAALASVPQAAGTQEERSGR